MIFCFSATGNSLDLARRLCAEGESPVEITACLQDGRFDFSIAENEPVELVSPVYCGGVPQCVSDFLARLSLPAPPAWLAVVLTESGAAGEAPAVFAREMSFALGRAPDAVYTVRMPENNVIEAALWEEDAVQETIAAAHGEIEAIRAAIDKRTPCPAAGEITEQTARLRAHYDEMRQTAPFHVADTCVHCGVCASRCPSGALIMQNGTPTWVKDRCSLCMACIRCGAILYGERITGKPRYVHPMLRKKKAM